MKVQASLMAAIVQKICVISVVRVVRVSPRESVRLNRFHGSCRMRHALSALPKRITHVVD